MSKTKYQKSNIKNRNQIYKNIFDIFICVFDFWSLIFDFYNFFLRLSYAYAIISSPNRGKNDVETLFCVRKITGRGSLHNAARPCQEERRGRKEDNRHISTQVPAESPIHKDLKRRQAPKGPCMHKMPQGQKGHEALSPVFKSSRLSWMELRPL